MLRIFLFLFHSLAECRNQDKPRNNIFACVCVMIDKDDVCIDPNFPLLPSSSRHRLNLKLCGGDSSIEQMRQISHEARVCFIMLL